MTRLTAEEIAVLDPYKFMAVIGKQVIHPGGRASTESLARAIPYLGNIVVVGIKPGLPASHSPRSDGAARQHAVATAEATP